MSVESTEKVVPKKRRPWKGVSIGFATFSVIVLLATGIFVFFEFLKMYDQLIGSSSQSQHQIKILQTEIKNLKNTSDQSQQKIEDFQSTLVKIKESLNQLSVTETQSTLQLHFAFNLIKMANLRLSLEQNIPAALDILKLADQALIRIETPQGLSLRKALATDILNLQNVAVVDISGIYLKLAAINSQIEQLPLIQPFSEKKDENNKIVMKSAQTWQESLDNVWGSLRDLVVIRYHPSDKIPLLSPNQQIFIYENLHAYLLQAMWAVLHAQPDIYQANLKQIQTILKEYFLQDSPITANILKTITDLANINIRPDIPKMTSLEALVSTEDVH